MKTKIILNSDEEHVKAIREALKNNQGFCPCATLKSPDTKCMCKEFREQEEGFCHCMLYQKVKTEE